MKIAQRKDTGLQGELLSQGATADVFARGAGYVLKLFHAGTAAAAVEYEARIARLVVRAGVSAPGVAALQGLDGRPGIVYERIDGALLMERMLASPRSAIGGAWLFGTLHARLHRQRQPLLPDRRDRLREQIGASALAAGLKAGALDALARLPGGATICHGDFHPGNILLTARGAVVIDWNDATAGDPLSDVARTVLIMRYASPPPFFDVRSRQRFAVLRRVGCAIYLTRYRMLRPYRRGALLRWLLPVAAGRLSERIPPDEHARLTALMTRLLRVDAGDFAV